MKKQSGTIECNCRGMHVCTEDKGLELPVPKGDAIYPNGEETEDPGEERWSL